MLDMPALLSVEINSHCNRTCAWCPNHSGNREEAYLDIGIIQSVLEQCKGYVKDMNFNNFNEPCLDPRLVDIVKLAKSILGSSTVLYLNTNGDLLTRALYDQLREAGLALFNISDYDAAHRINFTPTHTLQDVQLYNRAGQAGAPTPQPLKKRCPKPFSEFVVNYKGQAVLCCSDYRGDVILGDLRTDSVRDIWHGEILTRYREQLNQNNREGLTLCSVCDF
jgi:MoaA/NifB/PqqE/SkfB family radical SAM enzyme